MMRYVDADWMMAPGKKHVDGKRGNGMTMTISTNPDTLLHILFANYRHYTYEAYAVTGVGNPIDGESFLNFFA